jgi:ABC-type lipoprotein export system ATPase subunit
MIRVSKVDKCYGDLQVLKEVDLEFTGRQEMAIGGASGSGKSTLLYLLGGLDRPDRGEIEIEGQRIDQYNDEQLAGFRNQKIGFVFQFHFLLPSMNCLENTLLPAKIGGHRISKVKKQVFELAEYLGVVKELEKYPFQLSGGQQQRINLIRAVSLAPPVLLCDEPTGNLDSHNSKLVIDLLLEMAKQSSAQLIVVSHDKDVVSRFQTQYEMIDGQLHQLPPSF